MKSIWFIPLVILPLLSIAQESGSLPEWKKRRSALEKSHVVEEFRIFYSLEGKDGLPDAIDKNKNDIPDRIENIGLQLIAARKMYVDVFKLRHPLKSPRYKDSAKSIDINVGNLPFSGKGPKLNGTAGDAVVNYYRSSDGAEGLPALSIDVLNTLSEENLTPAHELFHLFQYGYTMFKNGWFLEGSDRWVESAFGKGMLLPTSVPQKESELKELFAKRYSAGGFWSMLAVASDRRGSLRIPGDLESMQYIGTESEIVKDTKFNGTELVRELLEALDKADDRATQAYGVTEFEWKEALQRDEKNNAYLWEEVVKLAGPLARKSLRMKKMIELKAPGT